MWPEQHTAIRLALLPRFICRCHLLSRFVAALHTHTACTSHTGVSPVDLVAEAAAAVGSPWLAAVSSEAQLLQVLLQQQESGGNAGSGLDPASAHVLHAVVSLLHTIQRLLGM